MEGLNPTDFNESSNVQIVSQEEMKEEAMNNAVCSTSDQKYVAPTDLREIGGSGYIMAQHFPDLWAIISQKLKDISEEGAVTSDDFIEVISFFTNDERFQTSHRKKQKNISEFMLKDFFNSIQGNNNQRLSYQNEVLPGIINLVLETNTLFPNGKTFPLLRQDTNKRIVLTKKQCACLLAHMVVCITRDQENDKLAELINLSVIYGKAGLAKNVARKIHKIKCIFTYFEKFFKDNQEGEVIFERSFLEGDHTEKVWLDCDETLTRAEIRPEGSIEDTQDALQVVFSDRQLGDQVLQLPTTQQQIMSLIHPELILSILFCEELKSDEAVRVYGAGRFSNYKGYGDSFEFVGSFREDVVDRRQHVIMDAEKYHSKQAASQFSEKCVIRELNKAYAGFQTENLEEGDRKKVATGKWGCGVFRGNPQLKFMIQWLAASRASREIVFYTYDDAKNFSVEDVHKVLGYYEGKEVGKLFKDLEKATTDMQTEDEKVDDENKNLFGVLIKQLGL